MRRSVLACLLMCLSGALSEIACAQDDEWLLLDNEVRKNFNPSAHEFSYDTMYAAVGFPLGLLLSHPHADGRVRYFGAALGANLGLTYAAKFSVARPRPYNHNPSAEARAFAESGALVNNLSFYSGHASTAFVGGVGGSLLMRDLWSTTQHRDIFWFVQMSLASTTAAMRVVAGVHYYTDVFVGALMGTAIAYASASASVETLDVQPGEYGAALLGILVGAWSATAFDYPTVEGMKIEPGALGDGFFGFRATKQF